MASTLCAIHCVVVPIVIAAAPTLSLGVLAEESTEWILIGLVGLVGMASLAPGYVRHRRMVVPALFGAGLALLISGRFLEESEAVPELVVAGAAVTGGLMVAAAHLLNRRWCRSCAEEVGAGSAQGLPVRTFVSLAPSQEASAG